MTEYMIQPFKTLKWAGLGFFVRVLVMSNFKEPIRQRIEVTTPIGSWKRAYEGVHLWNSGIDPYSAFAATDIVTAILLQLSVYNQIIISGNPKEKNTQEKAKSQSFMVLLIYLFNPMTIMSCAGTSTSIFTNFLISVINFILPMKPFRSLTCVLCAFLACNNLHYTSLILPIFLCLEYCKNKRLSQTTVISNQDDKQPQKDETATTSYYQNSNFYSSLSTSAIIFLNAFLTLMITSYYLMGNSWSFLSSTYLFVLKVQDLTPNIGMFWYFFAEMFEQFLDFFTWTIQINAFIHVIPLSINLRDDPFFLLYINILTSTIFQPYPSLSNIGLLISLLPQWYHLFQHMRRGFIVICAGLVSISLWPVFWHLWITMGTANSNFYFGATLAFSVTLILFMNDILSAHGYSNAKMKFGHYKDE